MILNSACGRGVPIQPNVSLLEQSEQQLLLNNGFDTSSTLVYYPPIEIGDIIEEELAQGVPGVLTQVFNPQFPIDSDDVLTNVGSGTDHTIYQTNFTPLDGNVSLYGTPLSPIHGGMATFAGWPSHRGIIWYNPPGDSGFSF